MHVFELGPKIFEMHVFACNAQIFEDFTLYKIELTLKHYFEVRVFSFPKKRAFQNHTVYQSSPNSRYEIYFFISLFTVLYSQFLTCFLDMHTMYINSKLVSMYIGTDVGK